MSARSRPSLPDPGRRLGLSVPALRAKLERMTRRFGRGYLDTDPVGLVRRFDDPSDREVAALLAAGLAYGRVASIRASLERLFGVLGGRPGGFVDTFDRRRDAARLDGFVHRFTTGADVSRLLELVRRARENSGSLEAFFVAGDADPSSPTLGPAMDSFVTRFFALDGRPSPPGARLLLTAPSAGSVCKRHCLFLRWMVRPDDGVDCGVWTSVSRRRLVVPLDTHLLRVARALGWTRRSSPTWAMALEVTEALRALDPDDPVRHDFALSRLGILGRLDAPGGRLALNRLARAFDEFVDAPAPDGPNRGTPRAVVAP